MSQNILSDVHLSGFLDFLPIYSMAIFADIMPYKRRKDTSFGALARDWGSATLELDCVFVQAIDESQDFGDDLV